MKRTILLIGLLIFISSFLLVYALSSNPPRNGKNNIREVPSKSITLTTAAETVLSFYPENISLASTDSASFDINISTGRNQVSEVQLELAYDPKALADIQIQPGNFIPAPITLLNINDSKTGRLSYALSVSPSQSPLSGTGSIATLMIKKNTSLATPNRTTITILPKSLVSSRNVSGSMLREVKNATIIFPLIPTVNIISPSIGVFKITQHP
jgi:hypothetical protein